MPIFSSALNFLPIFLKCVLIWTAIIFARSSIFEYDWPHSAGYPSQKAVFSGPPVLCWCHQNIQVFPAVGFRWSTSFFVVCEDLGSFWIDCSSEAHFSNRNLLSSSSVSDCLIQIAALIFHFWVLGSRSLNLIKCGLCLHYLNSWFRRSRDFTYIFVLWALVSCSQLFCLHAAAAEPNSHHIHFLPRALIATIFENSCQPAIHHTIWASDLKNCKFGSFGNYCRVWRIFCCWFQCHFLIFHWRFGEFCKIGRTYPYTAFQKYRPLFHHMNL